MHSKAENSGESAEKARFSAQYLREVPWQGPGRAWGSAGRAARGRCFAQYYSSWKLLDGATT